MNNLLNAAYDADNKAIRTTATGSATTIADGADVTQGAIADASVAAGATGTISAKLRRISADIDSIKTALATSATGMVKLEDSVHSSGDAGIPSWNVANEAQTTLASDGDYIPHSADTKGNTIVVGNVASGATDSGAPLKMSGVYRATLPTVTDGQRVDAQMGTRGAQNVTLWAQDSANPIIAVATNSDGLATSANTNRLQVVSLQHMYNSSSFDRVYSNWQTTILSSSVRATTTNGADQTNYNGRGAALTINVTVEAATETLSLKIQGKDTVTGNYYDIVDFGVVYNATTDAPTTTRTLIVYPGVLSADFVGISGNGTSGKAGLLPRIWRPVVTHSASGNWTYSLGSAVIL